MELGAAEISLAWESRFNAFLLLPTDPDYEIEKVSRDGGTVVNELVKMPKVFLEIQHVTTSWFGKSVEETLQDRAAFDRVLNELGSGFKVTALQNSPAGPHGFVASNKKCKVARFGKRVSSSKIYDNDHGQIDTYVLYFGCRPDAPSGDLVVERLDIATEGEKASVQETYKNLPSGKQALANSLPAG